MTTYLPTDPAHVATLQRYARVAGVAMLLSVVFGFLGEMYLPEQFLVAGDPAATAANIRANPSLFRLSFAAYLVEGICDVSLAVFWYILLRPVDRNLALLSAFIGVIATATFATAQSAFFSASVILRDTSGMATFAPEQREALAFLATRIATVIGTLFIGFYGLATMLRGYLIARSGYLPRVLGILFFVGGLGFFLRNVTYLLAPALSSQFLLLPMAAGGIPLMAWLLIKGIRTNEAR